MLKDFQESWENAEISIISKLFNVLQVHSVAMQLSSIADAPHKRPENIFLSHTRKKKERREIVRL
jgi:hypothetical protein